MNKPHDPSISHQHDETIGESMKTNTIAITGAAGYFAQCFIPRLERDANIERIIAIDRQEPARLDEWDKVIFHKMDIRDPELGHLLKGVDILVHLAFVLMKLPGAKDIDDINIAGSRNVLSLAAAAGIPKIVFTSSVVAYGIREDNPVPLREEHPLRPNTDLYYSRNKAAVESVLHTIASENPSMQVTILRPCTVVGAHADPASMASLTSKTITLVRGFNPLYQLVHENDVASALHLAIKRDMPGTFNVCSDEPRTLADLAEAAGKRTMALPLALVKPMFQLLWSLKATVFAPEWVKLTQFPIVASNEKLKTSGWKPEFTTTEAFLDLQKAFTDEGSIT